MTTTARRAAMRAPMRAALRARLAAAVLAALTGIATVAVTTPASGAARGGARAADHSVAVAHSVAAAGRSPVPASTLHWAINERVCPLATRPDQYTCMAWRRVPVAAGTPGSYAYPVPVATAPGRASSYADGAGRARARARGTAMRGPAGGYSPAALAAAYRYDPQRGRGMTVALVDWYSAPTMRRDLAGFDRRYGLRPETAASLRIVNQAGAESPLPRPDRRSSVEISLDVEAVRAVCQRCHILLVEAARGDSQDLAIAENTAVRLGADVVSNSFGIPEQPEQPLPRFVVRAFDHPGTVITASSGDNGWFFWDIANDDRSNYHHYAPEAASFPASNPHVVSVGGTNLKLRADGARITETVWNGNGSGDADANGTLQHRERGASGGGCSALFRAPSWQRSTPGYGSTGCAGKRLSVDVSAVGDPATGFDVLDSYGLRGWATIGGTSLSAPVLAGLWALAGGARGVADPAQTLYANLRYRPTSLSDVVAGGNGWCGGLDTADCSSASSSRLGTANPNVGYGALVDCSFARTGTTVPPASDRECTAAAGFDGASGVGTPADISALQPTTPVLGWSVSTPVRLKQVATFRTAVYDPVDDATVAKRTWDWGDGTTSADVGVSTTHTFTRTGRFTVTLTVLDSVGQTASLAKIITIGRPLHLRVQRPAQVLVGRRASFSAAQSSDPNAGAHIVTYRWAWGDHSTSTGVHPTHAYRRPGLKTLTLTAGDDSGVVTSRTFRVQVRR